MYQELFLASKPLNSAHSFTEGMEVDPKEFNAALGEAHAIIEAIDQMINLRK